MFPRIFPVRQQVTAGGIDDVAAAVRAELRSLPLDGRIRAGMRVAVGVGSRGISCLREVVSTVVEELLALGAKPFLVPAMGSHGGGTAVGQEAVLVGYGLGPDHLGIPIHSDLSVIQVGSTSAGMPVYVDAQAATADAILVINRIKPHTAFRNRWESGLMKILAVGLGKERGAATIHRWGLRDAMPEAARVILQELPVVAGVAIVENGQHRPARVTVLGAERIEQAEPGLLEEAWQHLPRIPFDPLDVLVLREIGKDLSGTGMDLNVVGMWRRTGGEVTPRFSTIVALDLTAASHGNAVGVGYADVITTRLRDKIDWQVTHTNCLVSGNYNGGKLPIALATDRQVIAAAIADRTAPRIVLCRNTLELEELWVSEALTGDVATSPSLTQIGPAVPIPFDEQGMLGLFGTAP